jgi:5'(3')-deoxyribonucleotidase
MTDYTGHDLIFAAGAPGSKWSRILSMLGLHPSINNSDKDKYPKYTLNAMNAKGKMIPVGNHSGAYFGPGNVVGEKFDDLTRLTKEQFIEEIKPSFDNWEQGIKIVKSHWFSYDDNLNWLMENFPDAKIILVYNGNDVAFKWWHYVGGWDISFPTYTWYANDQRMYNKILEENHHLLKFAEKHLVPIRMYKNFTELLQELELSSDLDFINQLSQDDVDLIKSRSIDADLIEQFNNGVKGAAIGVFSNNSIKCKNITEYNNHLSESDILLAQRHNAFQIDQLLAKRHNPAWLEQIDGIIASASFTDK